MTKIPLNVVSVCTAMLDGSKPKAVVTYSDGSQTWQARRIHNGYQFVLVEPAPCAGVDNVPLPFPAP